ncbi:MAG: hypothetical protein KIH69_002940 [Anaerolineae bacterium]|nr:hypothetical protein [Anaerolineae bacterium]
MVKILTATYDGSTLVPSSPISLAKDIAYLITVQPITEVEIAQQMLSDPLNTITERLNQVYKNLPAKLDEELAQMQWASLAPEEW